ncbi:MAG TPA: TadE/TadG family type IV pilus assembly protein [Terriglobia bacterium]|nr:TadE/TadG family type IV pilus assembly protein [Terriglobia bacterium]
MQILKRARRRHSRSRKIPSVLCRLLGQNGQSLVEISLMLPVILVTLVGTIEIGRVAYASIEVSNAARAGVQFGSLNEGNAGNTSGMQQAALNDVNLTGMTATASYSCQCSNGSSTSCTSNTCTSSEHLEEYVTVTTSYTMNSLFKYPGIPQSFNLSGSATMRVSQ